VARPRPFSATEAPPRRRPGISDLSRYAHRVAAGLQEAVVEGDRKQGRVANKQHVTRGMNGQAVRVQDTGRVRSETPSVFT
jgi:hypothetical protein